VAPHLRYTVAGTTQLSISHSHRLRGNLFFLNNLLCVCRLSLKSLTVDI